MTDALRQLDDYQEGYELAQQEFGGRIEETTGDVSAMTEGSGLDVLKAAPADDMGFRPVEVDIRDYSNTPQILGRVLLMLIARDQIYSPAVIVPKPGYPRVVRVSRLPVPFVPSVGLTPGLQFGVAIEAETQATGFGDHGKGGQNPSPFEPGHFGALLTAGVSKEHGEALVVRGDKQSHSVIGNGLPNEFKSLGLLRILSIPRTLEIDTSRYRPGERHPLYWHAELEREGGAALAQYPGAVELLIGAAVNNMTKIDLDRAGQYVYHAVKGVS